MRSDSFTASKTSRPSDTITTYFVLQSYFRGVEKPNMVATGIRSDSNRLKLVSSGPLARPLTPMCVDGIPRAATRKAPHIGGELQALHKKLTSWPGIGGHEVPPDGRMHKFANGAGVLARLLPTFFLSYAALNRSLVLKQHRCELGQIVAPIEPGVASAGVLRYDVKLVLLEHFDGRL